MKKKDIMNSRETAHYTHANRVGDSVREFRHTHLGLRKEKLLLVILRNIFYLFVTFIRQISKTRVLYLLSQFAVQKCNICIHFTVEYKNAEFFFFKLQCII